MTAIGFNFADKMMKALVSAATRTSDKVAEGSSYAANRASSLAFIGLPIGMLLSLTTTEVFYDVKDTYFTNDESALASCRMTSIVLLTTVIFTDLFSLLVGSTPWSWGEESPLTTSASLKDVVF